MKNRRLYVFGGRYEIDNRSAVYFSTSSQAFNQHFSNSPIVNDAQGFSGEAQYSFVGTNLQVLMGAAALDVAGHQQRGGVRAARARLSSYDRVCLQRSISEIY